MAVSARPSKKITRNLASSLVVEAFLLRLCFEAVEDSMKVLPPGIRVGMVRVPIGHDLFHWDGAKDRKTVNGTDQSYQSVDSRLPKVWMAAVRSVRHMIRKAREIAPVHVIYVPGNHDRTISWMFLERMAAEFAGDKHVTFDLDWSIRKYHEYGSTLTGLTHGNAPRKLVDLKDLMWAESLEAFGRCRYHVWRLGHFHTEKQLLLKTTNEHGMRFDVLPSLAPADDWHHSEGYVCNRPAAEVLLQSKEHGFAGRYPVYAREDLYESANVGSQVTAAAQA